VIRRAILIAGLLTLTSVASAQATITLGQLKPAAASSQNCGPSSGAFVQPSVTSGTSYLVPTAGRIVSWSTASNGTGGQQLALMILRPVGGNTYLAVSHDGPRFPTPSVTNTFQTNLPVQAGDILGLDSSNTNFPTACGFQVTGETGEKATGSVTPPGDGQTGTFVPNPGNRINLSAQFDPSNAFTFTGTTRNKKKGRATTTVSIPGPGSLLIQGKGLTSQSITTTTLTSVGLGVIPNRKTRKKLLNKGKASVSPSVTYTPIGGTANTQSEAVKLLIKR
jgi:hypothetical protein